MVIKNNILPLNFSDKYYKKTNEHRILVFQEMKNINKYGRIKGNTMYKEDSWNVELKPLRYKTVKGVTSDNVIEYTTTKEARIRDKYCKIRVRYSGEELAIITALQTIYNLSFA